MIKYDYTQSMYDEDLKISNYVFNKFFSKYKHLKDDFIQIMLARLWQVRPNFNSSIGTYSTYAVCVCKNIVKLYLRKNADDTSNVLSLNEKTNDSFDDKQVEFQDTLIGEDMDDLDLDNSVLNLVNKIKSKSKNKFMPLIIDMTIKGYSQSEIVKKISSYTRQYVSKLVVEFKSNLSEKLQKLEMSY